MELKISLVNNSVSVPVFAADGHADREDANMTIEIVWENGDYDLVRLPIVALNEVLKTARMAKRNHPAFSGIKMPK